MKLSKEERTALRGFSKPGAVVGNDRAMFRKLLGRSFVACPMMSMPDDAPVLVTEYGSEALAERQGAG